MNLSSKSWPPERFKAWHTRDFPCRVTDQQNFTPKLPLESKALMTWIRTIPLSEASEKLRNAMENQKLLYPKEYAMPVHPAEGGGAQIVESHSLIPDALYHAFATFGSLMSPELPLSRRQHEMITTVVGHEPVRLLNRITRRVSASGHAG